MTLTAYIVPKVNVNGKEKTLVMKSHLGASIAFGESSLGVGYQIDVDETLQNLPKIIRKIGGIPKYNSSEDFYKKVETLVEETNLDESKIEKFCKKNGLIPTRLKRAW